MPDGPNLVSFFSVTSVVIFGAAQLMALPLASMVPFVLEGFPREVVNLGLDGRSSVVQQLEGKRVYGAESEHRLPFAGASAAAPLLQGRSANGQHATMHD